MKKLAIIIGFVSLIGCTKSNQRTTTTSTPPPVTSSSSTGTVSITQGNLTATWYLRRMTVRDTSSHTYTTYNIFSGVLNNLNLTSTPYIDSSGNMKAVGYQVINSEIAITCHNVWKLTGDSVSCVFPNVNPQGTGNITFNYGVPLLTSDSLILSQKTGATSYERWYFHK